MNAIKPLLLGTALFVSLTLPMVAETKSDNVADSDLAAAHKIIDAVIEATGGEEAFKKITSRVMKATMEMEQQGLKVNMIVSQKAPNKVHVIQEIPGLMKASQGFNGEKGWAEDPLQGSREIKGDELKQLKDEANMMRELELKEEYPKMKILPEEKDGDATLQVIEAESKDGDKETWYFDKETSLMVKSKQRMTVGPSGKLDVTLHFKDFREVDGLKIPHLTVLENAAFKGNLKVTALEHNVELKDALFEVPDEDEE